MVHGAVYLHENKSSTEVVLKFSMLNTFTPNVYSILNGKNLNLKITKFIDDPCYCSDPWYHRIISAGQKLCKIWLKFACLSDRLTHWDNASILLTGLLALWFGIMDMKVWINSKDRCSNMWSRQNIWPISLIEHIYTSVRIQTLWR